MGDYYLEDLMQDVVILMFYETVIEGLLMSLPGVFSGFYDPRWPRWSRAWKEMRYDGELLFWLKIYPKLRRLIAQGNQLKRRASQLVVRYTWN